MHVVPCGTGSLGEGLSVCQLCVTGDVALVGYASRELTGGCGYFFVRLVGESSNAAP